MWKDGVSARGASQAFPTDFRSDACGEQGAEECLGFDTLGDSTLTTNDLLPTAGNLLGMSTGRRAYNLLRGYVNREWERIQGVQRSEAERELDDVFSVSTNPTAPAPAQGTPVVDRNTRARTILGVVEGASFPDVQKAFERLNKRSDPSNFPAGSAEAVQAAEIQKQIHWAYGVLSEGHDTTERRFRSLEID